MKQLNWEKIQFELETMGRYDRVYVDGYTIAKSTAFMNGYVVQGRKCAEIFSSAERVIDFLKTKRR